MADPSLASIAKSNRDAANNMAVTAGRKRTLKLLEAAERDLSRRLANVQSVGPEDAPFTAVQMEATRRQIAKVVSDLNKGLKGTLLSQGEHAADLATGDLLDYLGRANKKFKGVGQVLPITEAAMLDRVRMGVRSSVLNRIASFEPGEETGDTSGVAGKPGILQRYGTNVIEHFEETLQIGLLAQKPWAEIRTDVVGRSPFLQQAPAFWAERLVRTECLTADTEVSGAMVRAAFRREYQGCVVEVITERGRKFTTTPNHPMLTRRGWVGTGDLRVSDYLVCYVGNERACPTGDEYVDRGPTTVSQIFDTLATVGVTERRTTAKPDFHGDGVDGDVDIARIGRVLGVGRFAPIYKPLFDDVFAPSNARARFCRSCGGLLPIQHRQCFCARASSDSRLVQASLDCAVGYVKGLRQLLSAISGHVGLNDLIGRQLQCAGMPYGVESVLGGVGTTASQSDPLKMAFELIGGYADRSASTLGAHTSDIELDRIKDLRFKEYRGHVYNLETPVGYFAIGGAYTGNTMGAYNRASFETIRTADEELGDMVKILSATFDDRTGWDSYQVHGQIRLPDEAFEWAGGAYQSPPNRPNDREVVIPHRISWPIPDYLHWRNDGEVMSRYRMQRKSGSPGPRPVMTTVALDKFGKDGLHLISGEVPGTSKGTTNRFVVRRLNTMPPFKLNTTPDPKVEERRILTPSYSELVDHALGEPGERLDDAARELGAPDHPVGMGPPVDVGQGEGDHPQTPVYPMPNPFPKISPPTPFKNLKLGRRPNMANGNTPGNGSSSPFALNGGGSGGGGTNFVKDPAGSQGSAGGHNFLKDPSSAPNGTGRDFTRESRGQTNGGPEANPESVPAGGKMPFGDPTKGPRGDMLGTLPGNNQRKPFVMKDATPAPVDNSGAMGDPGLGAADAGTLPVGSLSEV